MSRAPLTITFATLGITLASCSNQQIESRLHTKKIEPRVLPASNPIEIPILPPVEKSYVENSEVLSFTATQILIPKIGINQIPIVQQKWGDFGYVSSEENTMTQFQGACKPIDAESYINPNGTANCYALLAHNTLYPGQDLNKLAIGDEIYLINGENQEISYKVSSVEGYRATDPRSGSSDFISLQTGAVYTYLDVFNMYYQNSEPFPKLVMQTCITIDGIDTAGRLFIVAEPQEIIGD